jgi:hypothetical protein
MAITTLAQYEGAVRDRIYILKENARGYSGSAGHYHTSWDASGTGGAGVLNVGNTANGLVPTDATTGAPDVPFGTGTGHITHAEFCTDSDRLFHAGAYAFNASTTLASQPSFSSRVPGGDYNGLEIWIEGVTAFTGIGSIVITYTNQAGTTGRTAGTVSWAAGSSGPGRMMRVPFASGDCGVQRIDSVTCTVASAGTFNVLVARPLATMYLPVSFAPNMQALEILGMPQVYNDSCLALATQIVDGSADGIQTLELALEIASA